MKHTTLVFVATIALSMFSGCGDEKDNKPTGEKTYSTHSAWDCDGNYCQDIYDFSFEKGSVVDFDVSNLTGGSVVQVALYAPGQDPGETNLFTNSTSEITCITNGCDNNTSGYFIGDFIIPASGRYRLAVTRNHGSSCGSDGEYDLDLTSDKNFVFKGQSADNTESLAPEEPTQVCVN
jgi:hypothetical protein